MKHTKTLFLAQGALIAALYVAMTYLAMLFGLDKGVIQFRLSEILTILPFFTPAAIPGLFAGCLLANVLTGCALWDIVFGSLATLLGACGTYLLRRWKWLAPLPPILANMLIVPFVLRFVYAAEGSIPFFMLTVGIGEIVTAGICGMILLLNLQTSAHRIFHPFAKKN